MPRGKVNLCAELVGLGNGRLDLVNLSALTLDVLDQVRNRCVIDICSKAQSSWDAVNQLQRQQHQMAPRKKPANFLLISTSC